MRCALWHAFADCIESGDINSHAFNIASREVTPTSHAFNDCIERVDTKKIKPRPMTK